MSKAATPPEPLDTKPCKVCGEKIKKVARVCIHCDNYQNWRADLNISTTVLSLLVALVSVTTGAAPGIIGALRTKDSNLVFAYQGATDKTIAILATNRGTRPGSAKAIAGLVISPNAYLLSWGTSQQVSLHLVGDVPAVVIDPDKSILLQFAYKFNPGDQIYTNSMFKSAKKVDMTSWPGNNKCSVFMYATSFLGESQYPTIVRLDCWDLGTFVDNMNKAIENPSPPAK